MSHCDVSRDEPEKLALNANVIPAVGSVVVGAGIVVVVVVVVVVVGAGFVVVGAGAGFVVVGAGAGIVVVGAGSVVVGAGVVPSVTVSVAGFEDAEPAKFVKTARNSSPSSDLDPTTEYTELLAPAMPFQMLPPLVETRH